SRLAVPHDRDAMGADLRGRSDRQPRTTGCARSRGDLALPESSLRWRLPTWAPPRAEALPLADRHLADCDPPCPSSCCRGHDRSRARARLMAPHWSVEPAHVSAPPALGEWAGTQRRLYPCRAAGAANIVDSCDDRRCP